MINVKRFVFNSFFENTYIVYDDLKQAIIFDPGMCYQGEDNILYTFIEEKALRVQAILNTHAHIDHILGLNSLYQKYKIKSRFHQLELPIFQAVPSYALQYGYPEYRQAPISDFFLQEGHSITFAQQDIQVMFCPGHSPGHVCFYFPQDNFLIGGDVLFYRSIGRTDLPGGDSNQLLSSIKEKLFSLPLDCRVYCGHGEETEIGEEKRENPFLL